MEENTCCAAQEGHLSSAVDFDTNTRPHISLNVTSVKNSLPFYKTLFRQNPKKYRDDYAKFEPDAPPVNFTINEHPDHVQRDGHFGIEVKNTDQVREYYDLFMKSKVAIRAEETDVACCFAVQNKIWVADPDGNHWEIFVVVDDEADEGCEASCICYNPESGGCDWQA